MTSSIENYIDQFISFSHINEDHCIWNIEPLEQSLDSKKTFDQGLLIALLDTFSIWSGHMLKKVEGNISLSMNIKVTTFEEMYANNKYTMEVRVISSERKIVLYEILILNEEGKKIKYATHQTRLISARF